ncbi:MAG: hypothetical protein LQ338_007040 [Usnochroma carphineum]|nr:MAG: hypothetical protein LQ338_007040 [Usnochroma carphineum]
MARGRFQSSRQAIAGICLKYRVVEATLLRNGTSGKTGLCNMNWSLWLRAATVLFFLLKINVFCSVDAVALDLDNKRSPQPFEASGALTESDTHLVEFALSRRAFKNIEALGAGWVGHIVYSDAIYPYVVGAQILGKFYRSVMHSASKEWIRETQRNTYLILIGTIRLWIWSQDPLARISWNFVHDFASRMLIATQLGFVGLFDGSFVHLASGVTVHTKLIIMGKSPPE